MKYAKLFLAAACALSLAACTSPAEDEEVKKTENVVDEDDKKAIDEAQKEDAAADENGGMDADYGTPENSDSDTKEVPTTADEQQEDEQETNLDTDQNN